MRKKHHLSTDLPRTGRKAELLQALNVAAASLQRSAHSETEVFRAVSEQISGLGLRGSLSMLDEECERLIIRAVIYPARILASLEKLTGLAAEGYAFAVAKADVYRQVVETRKSVFVPDTTAVVLQLLPEPAQPFGERILKALGTPPAIYAPIMSDKRVRWVLNVAGPGLTADDVHAVEAFANHISVALDNARLYAETRATRDYYNTLLNSLHDQILVIDHDYVITDVNEALLHATGYTRGQVIGRHCYEISHGLDFPCWQYAEHPCPVEEVWQMGRAGRATHLHRDESGRPVYINVAMSPLFDDSGQVTGAIESFRDVTAEKRLEDRLEAIYQLGQELSLLRDEAAIVQRVLEIAADLLRFEVAGCGLVDEAAGELVYRYLVGSAAGVTGEKMRLRLALDRREALGIGVAVVRSREAINVHDTAQDLRYLPLLEDSSARSELCVPMKVEERVIGVLHAQSVEPSHFTLDDQQLLQALADQAAVALRNAWLFNELRQRAIQLQTAAEVSRAASSVLEPDQLLPQVVELICERFDLYYVGLFLVDEAGEWAVLRAGTGKAGQIQLERGHRLRVGGESMVGWCAANAQARIALDVGREAVRFDNPLLPDTRSEMALPLICRGKTIGALTVQSIHPMAFSQADITTLQTMADQLAIAIDNARLYQAERAPRQELEALQQASLSLTASLELPQVLDAILQAALHLISAQDAHVFLYAEGRLTYGAALWADGRRETPYSEARPDGLTYTVARRGEPIIVPDMRTHPLFANTPPDWQGTIVGLPLKIGERVVGVMNIARAEPGGISEAKLRVLHLLADQAAIAVENARLHAETERRAEQLAVLHELDRAITASLRIDDVYHAFARHTARLLPYDRMAIALVEEDEMCVTYVAGRDKTQLTVGDRLPLHASGVGWVATLSQPLLRDNIAADMRFAEDPLLMTIGIQSSMIVPLRVKGRVIGTWNIGSQRVEAYRSDDLAMAQAMADQLAIAIENARLHEDLQAQLDALRNAQARLVQSEKLAAIGELVAGVAHELNNPLTSIIGFAQLLQYSELDNENWEDLDKIVTQARRAAGIVRSLLDFARQRPPERKPVQVNDVLGSTLNLLAYELRTRNIEWTTHYSPDLPLTMADPQQLQQVFVNLVHNACQAMNEARGYGHLDITSALVPSAFLDHQHGAKPVIRVVIQDDGPGIPPDILPRIFNPFFTTKPPGEGTGLGLAVCHGIVSEHGGHIWAESEADQGTAFFVELPLVAPLVPHPVRAPERTQQSASYGAAHILVVDDEQEVLELIARSLQREGYQVDAVSDGQTALSRISETSYDLILCDVRMSGLSGQDIYRMIADQDIDLLRRIIFITGDTMSPATRRFLEGTDAPYLDKPFELADLLKKVQTVITGR